MKVLALDRDGVINFDSDSYILNKKNWRPIPGSLEAIKKAKSHGFTIAVVSNQSALGRKMLDANSFHQINRKFFAQLKQHGGQIDLYLVCPHTPEQNCNCRKPAPGMLLQASKDFNIIFSNAIMIGDKKSDMEAALSVGIPDRYLIDENMQPNKDGYKHSTRRFKSLLDSVNYILQKL